VKRPYRLPGLKKLSIEITGSRKSYLGEELERAVELNQPLDW